MLELYKKLTCSVSYGIFIFLGNKIHIRKIILRALFFGFSLIYISIEYFLEDVFDQNDITKSLFEALGA